MSQDLTHLPKRETSLLVYADEVCHSIMSCSINNRPDILYKQAKVALDFYVMDMGWWP